jgi:hypothetical protein
VLVVLFTAVRLERVVRIGPILFAPLAVDLEQRADLELVRSAAGDEI